MTAFDSHGNSNFRPPSTAAADSQVGLWDGQGDNLTMKGAQCDATAPDQWTVGEEALRNKVWTQLAWDKTRHAKVDIRLFYAAARTDASAWTACRWDPTEPNYPSFFKFSHVSDYYPICYSTEALKYAQSGYLVSIVCVQWADLMICKTRNLSLSQQGMINWFGNFGLFFETALVAILLYVPFLNIALGTRQIPFAHFAVPSFSFYVAIFFYDELRKIWLRNGMSREEGGKLRLKGWIVQNTYY